MSLADDLRDAVGDVLSTLAEELGSTADVQQYVVIGYDAANVAEKDWQTIAGGGAVSVIITSVQKRFAVKAFGADTDVTAMAILRDSAIVLAGGERIVVRSGAYAGMFFKVTALSPEFMGDLMLAGLVRLQRPEATT